MKRLDRWSNFMIWGLIVMIGGLIVLTAITKSVKWYVHAVWLGILIIWLFNYLLLERFNRWQSDWIDELIKVHEIYYNIFKLSNKGLLKSMDKKNEKKSLKEDKK